MTQASPPRQSIIGLARELVRGVIELGRLEATRGRQEVGQMVDDTKAGVLLMGIALGLMFMALMVLVIFIVLILAAWTGLPGWVIALVVLFLLRASGALVAYIGSKRIRVGPPEETIQAVQEDIEWARRLLRRG